jgi:hypothetical protein
MKPIRLLITGLLAAAVVFFIAYGFSIVVGGSKTVEGQVIGVEQQSLTTISSLTVEDASGQQWVFQGAGTFAGFTPSHLREHAAQRVPVIVEYEKSGSEQLTIVGLSD